MKVKKYFRKESNFPFRDFTLKDYNYQISRRNKDTWKHQKSKFLSVDYFKIYLHHQWFYPGIQDFIR